jgi:hypothetical protein
MTEKKPFFKLMIDLMTNLGLSGAQASEAGVYSIFVDNRIEVHIGCPDEKDLFMYCFLGPLAVDASDPLAQSKALLGLNEMTTKWSPTVYLTPDNNVGVWCQTALSDLDLTTTVGLFAMFLDAVLPIDRLLHDLPEEVSTPELDITKHTLKG